MYHHYSDQLRDYHRHWYWQRDMTFWSEVFRKTGQNYRKWLLLFSNLTEQMQNWPIQVGGLYALGKKGSHPTDCQLVNTFQLVSFLSSFLLISTLSFPVTKESNTPKSWKSSKSLPNGTTSPVPSTVFSTCPIAAIAKKWCKLLSILPGILYNHIVIIHFFM